MAGDYRRNPGARRGRMRRRNRRFAAASGLSRRILGDPGRRPEPRRDRAGGARCGGRNRRRRAANGVGWAGVAGGLDRKAVGAAPGGRSGLGCGAAAGLPAAHRCRHRLRAGCAQEPRRAGAIGQVCPDLADGEAALREPRRAHVHPGFHLLLPDALPVLLGERSAPCYRRRGRRLHAGARRCARPSRRHGRDPQRLDRRLRAGESVKGAAARSGSD